MMVEISAKFFQGIIGASTGLFETGFRIFISAMVISESAVDLGYLISQTEVGFCDCHMSHEKMYKREKVNKIQSQAFLWVSVLIFSKFVFSFIILCYSFHASFVFGFQHYHPCVEALPPPGRHLEFQKKVQPLSGDNHIGKSQKVFWDLRPLDPHNS